MKVEVIEFADRLDIHVRKTEEVHIPRMWLEQQGCNCHLLR